LHWCDGDGLAAIRSCGSSGACLYVAEDQVTTGSGCILRVSAACLSSQALAFSHLPSGIALIK